MTGPTEATFWANTLPVDSGCWEWQGARVAAGYGRCTRDEAPIRGIGFLAHRIAYTIANGPIPDGLVIDHLCRNKACVNPCHLEAVTNVENIRRGIIRWPRTIATRCKNGHDYTPENTYIAPMGARSCRTCNRAYNAWYHATQRRRRR